MKQSVPSAFAKELSVRLGNVKQTATPLTGATFAASSLKEIGSR